MTQEERSALTEAVFYILLSLYTPLHGYGIMQYVKELTQGRVDLGPGTLYGALTTLVEKGWIKTMDNPTDARRKEYEITPQGKQAIKAELTRLEELLNHGRMITRGNL